MLYRLFWLRECVGVCVWVCVWVCTHCEHNCWTFVTRPQLHMFLDDWMPGHTPKNTHTHSQTHTDNYISDIPYNNASLFHNLTHTFSHPILREHTPTHRLTRTHRETGKERQTYTYTYTLTETHRHTNTHTQTQTPTTQWMTKFFCLSVWHEDSYYIWYTCFWNYIILYYILAKWKKESHQSENMYTDRGHPKMT